MTARPATPRRRGDNPPMKAVNVSLPEDVREALARAAEADGVADGSLARAALMRGLPLELDARRKRRARAAGRDSGQGEP